MDRVRSRPHVGGNKPTEVARDAGGLSAPAATPSTAQEGAPEPSQSPAEGRALVPVASGDGTQQSAVGVRLRRDVVPARGSFGTPAFEAALDAATKSRRTNGNSAQLLFDGVASFQERHKVIDAAKSSIHLQTFIFTDDEAGWAMAHALAAKAREGVTVRVIVDAFGSQRTDPALFEMMRTAGVDVRMHKTGLMGANNRWHEKHLIVDGRVSIEGGMNIADEYALGGSGKAILSKYKRGATPWRDVDVRIEGEGVHDAQRAFLRNWKMLGGAVDDVKSLFPKPHVAARGVGVRVVQNHPADGEDHTLQLYLQSVRAATKSITIENAYFIPTKELRDALIDAARRGVQVRVLTNSKESGNHGAVVDAARYWYDEMLQAGIEIHERSGKSTLHSKTATFDGAYSIVGSANLNGRSDGLDTEVSIAINDTATAAQLERRFAEGLNEARAIPLAEVQADSFVTNLKQWCWSSLSWTL